MQKGYQTIIKKDNGKENVTDGKPAVNLKNTMGIFNRRNKKTPEETKKTPQSGAACQKAREALSSGDYDAAFAFFKEAAEDGDPAGINGLGACYFQGNGVEKDIAKALELYGQAAELGAPSAQYNLAVLYQKGRHIERDTERALHLFEKSAEQGYRLAQLRLADCLKNGTGTEKNLKKALYWYEKAAEQGDVNAQRESGNLYSGAFDMTLKNPEREAYWYKKAAEQGDPFSQYAIGDCYLRGEGIQKNFHHAKHWFLLSAEKGNEFGKFQLANAYAEEKDWEKYIFWLTSAAEQGLGSAQCNLGAEYVTGTHVEKDLKKALDWMEKAKENNIPQAAGAAEEILEMLRKEQYEKKLQELDAEQLLSLGQEYFQREDYKHAVPYIEKAAQTGLPAAQAMFGAWYAKGIDIEGQEIEPDLEKAQYWMEKAAAKGAPNAQESLQNIIRVRAADYYNKGIHKIKERIVNPALGITAEDFSEAETYLWKAGEIGLVEAQILLASHYLYGDCRCITQLRSCGIDALWTNDDIDTKKGMFWLRKAAEQEDPNSMFVYAKCLLWGPENIDSLAHTLFETGDEDGSRYKNTKEAFDMAVKASDLGCSEAAAWLSKAEKNHYPGSSEALRRTKSYQEWEEKERKRKEWWDKEGDRLEESFHAGQEYYEKKDYEKAIPYLMKAAEGGHKTAQQRLAYCYSNGLGIQQDEEKSTYWFFKSMDME